MHRVDILRELIGAARQLGYGVRQEWLDGVAGGGCSFGKRRWIFIDLSLPVEEQLEQVRSVLQEDTRLEMITLSQDARRYFQSRAA